MAFKKKRHVEEVILSALRARGECNFNALRKDTGLSYYTLNRVLENLVLKGIIVEKRVGRLRIIKMTENLKPA